MEENGIGFRLKRAREKCGLKQADVREQIPEISSVQSVSAYERGENNPPLEILKKLCILYGVSSDSILFGNDGLPQKEKTTSDYVAQMVDAVDNLKLNFTVYEDNDWGSTVHRQIDLTPSDYGGLDDFSEKWIRLRSLLDSNTLKPDEYKLLINRRLEELTITEKKIFPASEFAMLDDVDPLPF